MWFLILAGFILVLAVWARYAETKNDRKIQELKSIRANIAQLLNDSNKDQHRIADLNRHLTDHITKTEATFKAMKNEVDILNVRQRTLEKKIIGQERNVNLTITGALPVVSKPGRGKGALIPSEKP